MPFKEPVRKHSRAVVTSVAGALTLTALADTPSPTAKLEEPISQLQS